MRQQDPYLKARNDLIVADFLCLKPTPTFEALGIKYGLSGTQIGTIVSKAVGQSWRRHSPTESDRRHVRAYVMRLEGKKLREIGKEFNVGKERARTLAAGGERKLRFALRNLHHDAISNAAKSLFYGVTLTYTLGEAWPKISATPL